MIMFHYVGILTASLVVLLHLQSIETKGRSHNLKFKNFNLFGEKDLQFTLNN